MTYPLDTDHLDSVPLRCRHPGGRPLTPEADPLPLVDRMTDRRFWKHSLPALAVNKNYLNAGRAKKHVLSNYATEKYLGCDQVFAVCAEQWVMTQGWVIALCTTCTLYLSVRDLYFNFKAFDSTYLAKFFTSRPKHGWVEAEGKMEGVNGSGTKINTIVTDWLK